MTGELPYPITTEDIANNIGSGPEEFESTHTGELPSDYEEEQEEIEHKLPPIKNNYSPIERLDDKEINEIKEFLQESETTQEETTPAKRISFRRRVRANIFKLKNRVLNPNTNELETFIDSLSDQEKEIYEENLETLRRINKAGETFKGSEKIPEEAKIQESPFINPEFQALTLGQRLKFFSGKDKPLTQKLKNWGEQLLVTGIEMGGTASAILGLRNISGELIEPGDRENAIKNSVLKNIVLNLFKGSRYLHKFSKEKFGSTWSTIERSLSLINGHHLSMLNNEGVKTDNLYNEDNGCPIGMAHTAITLKMLADGTVSLITAHMLDGQTTKEISAELSRSRVKQEIQGSSAKAIAQTIRSSIEAFTQEEKTVRIFHTLANHKGEEINLRGLDVFQSRGMNQYTELVETNHISILYQGIELIYGIKDENGDFKDIDQIEQDIEKMQNLIDFLKQSNIQIPENLLINTQMALLNDQNADRFKELYDQMVNNGSWTKASKSLFRINLPNRNQTENDNNNLNNLDQAKKILKQAGFEFLLEGINMDREFLEFAKDQRNTKIGEEILTIPNEFTELDEIRLKMREFLEQLGMSEKMKNKITSNAKLFDMVLTLEGLLTAGCGVNLKEKDLEIVRTFMENDEDFEELVNLSSQLKEQISKAEGDQFTEEIKETRSKLRKLVIKGLIKENQAYDEAKNLNEEMTLNSNMVKLMKSTARVFSHLPKPVQFLIKNGFILGGSLLKSLYSGGEPFINDLRKIDLSQPAHIIEDQLFYAIYNSRKIPIELQRVYNGDCVTSLTSTSPNSPYLNIATTAGDSDKSIKTMVNRSLIPIENTNDALYTRLQKEDHLENNSGWTPKMDYETKKVKQYEKEFVYNGKTYKAVKSPDGQGFALYKEINSITIRAQDPLKTMNDVRRGLGIMNLLFTDSQDISSLKTLLT